MVAMIRPTLLLKMSVDESVYTEDVAAEIKRSFSYVSPALIEHHATGEHGVESIIRFIVKMRQPYWSSAEEGADELWNTVMKKWLTNMFAKVSTTASSSNALRREKGEPTLVYSWMDVEFADAVTVSLRLGSDSSIPDDAVESIDAVRTYANEAAFGQGEVVRVRIPSRLSLASHVENLDDATDAASKDVLGDAEALADTSSREQDIMEAAAAIKPTASIWGVEYADGSVREFDAASRSFIEDRLV